MQRVPDASAAPSVHEPKLVDVCKEGLVDRLLDPSERLFDGQPVEINFTGAPSPVPRCHRPMRAGRLSRCPGPLASRQHPGEVGDRHHQCTPLHFHEDTPAVAHLPDHALSQGRLYVVSRQDL